MEAPATGTPGRLKSFLYKNEGMFNKIHSDWGSDPARRHVLDGGDFKNKQSQGSRLGWNQPKVGQDARGEEFFPFSFFNASLSINFFFQGIRSNSGGWEEDYTGRVGIPKIPLCYWGVTCKPCLNMGSFEASSQIVENDIIWIMTNRLKKDKIRCI